LVYLLDLQLRQSTGGNETPIPLRKHDDDAPFPPDTIISGHTGVRISAESRNPGPFIGASEFKETGPEPRAACQNGSPEPRSAIGDVLGVDVTHS